MPKTAVGISRIPSAGFGLFALEKIVSGSFLGLYSGELCRPEDESSKYMWGYEKDTVIDAKTKGNKTRFMNDPKKGTNVTAKVVTALGTSYVVFTTVRDVDPGEELTLDYGKDRDKFIT